MWPVLLRQMLAQRKAELLGKRLSENWSGPLDLQWLHSQGAC